jgi:hypothetical protein
MNKISLNIKLSLAALLVIGLSFLARYTHSEAVTYVGLPIWALIIGTSKGDYLVVDVDKEQ